MSDPAKTPEEIEDVLASVRRLVADHMPKRESAAPTADAQITPSPSATSPQTEALVLTPSFRVTDPDDPWVPVTAAQGPDDHGAAVAPVASSRPPDEPAAEDAEDFVSGIVADAAAPADKQEEHAVQPNGAEWQPDDRLANFDAVGDMEGPTPAAQEWQEDHGTEVSEEDIEDLIRLDGAGEAVADFESETGDDTWPEAGAEAALLSLVARRDPAPDDAEPQPGPEHGPEHGAGAEAQDAIEDAAPHEERPADVDISFVADEDTPNAEDVPSQGDGMAPAPEDPTGDDITGNVTTGEDWTGEDGTGQAGAGAENRPEDDVAEKDFAQDRAQAAASDDTADAGDLAQEPVAADAEPEPLRHTTPIFSRPPGHGQETAEETAQGSAEDLGDTPSPFTFPEADLGILDEDTLREIIVDVVREELQGVLGQRITRNVRKMVRREIRLALAAEDLD